MNQKDRLIPNGEGEMERPATRAPLGKKSKQLCRSVYHLTAKAPPRCRCRNGATVGRGFGPGVLEAALARYSLMAVRHPERTSTGSLLSDQQERRSGQMDRSGSPQTRKLSAPPCPRLKAKWVGSGLQEKAEQFEKF